MWCSGLRIWRCHCCGMGSIRGLGTSTHQECRQKENKEIQLSTKKKIKIAYKFHLQRKSWLTFWPDGSGFGRSSSAHAYLIPFMWAAGRINGEGVRYPLPSARASHVQHHSQRHSRLCTRNTQVPTMSPCLSRFTPGTDSTSQNLKCDRSKPEVVIHQRHSLVSSAVHLSRYNPLSPALVWNPVGCISWLCPAHVHLTQLKTSPLTHPPHSQLWKGSETWLSVG